MFGPFPLSVILLRHRARTHPLTDSFPERASQKLRGPFRAVVRLGLAAYEQPITILAASACARPGNLIETIAFAINLRVKSEVHWNLRSQRLLVTRQRAGI